jgi:hypothetical protein
MKAENHKRLVKDVNDFVLFYREALGNIDYPKDVEEAKQRFRNYQKYYPNSNYAFPDSKYFPYFVEFERRYIGCNNDRGVDEYKEIFTFSSKKDLSEKIKKLEEEAEENRKILNMFE